MIQPTVFVSFKTQTQIALVISLIVKSVGAILVDKLTDKQEVEADIAVVNTIEEALTFLKETENTIVFLSYLGNTQKQEALAFASRFSQRVKAGPLVEAMGEENLMITLMCTITEMEKGTK